MTKKGWSFGSVLPMTKHEGKPSLSLQTMTDTATKSAGAPGVIAGKYLTFTLQGEAYGIDVLKVREIIRVENITVVPQMPSYIRGVINLRGKIIPVMDLRLRFEFSNVTNTDQTCIVVVQVKLPDGKVTPMGLVVDGVDEVINIAATDVEQTPDFGGQICTDYIIGIAKVKGAVKALLDIDGVVGADTLRKLRPVAA
jgi:purine-binding chemotaxis protein CheW